MPIRQLITIRLDTERTAEQSAVNYLIEYRVKLILVNPADETRSMDEIDFEIFDALSALQFLRIYWKLNFLFVNVLICHHNLFEGSKPYSKTS